jgi:CheY-like chemotaxis protein/HPt (histidine-containing phosphotransfer) domain-containing protein
MSQALVHGAGPEAAKRILIIEDDAVVARLYQNRLRKEGYRVEIAAEGQEGFFTILKDKPDGVLLDLMLPNMDGIQILRKTRAQKQFESIPIIVFSNSYINGMLDEAVAAGASRVFNKSDPGTTQNIVAGFMEFFYPSRSNALRAAAESGIDAAAADPGAGNTVMYRRTPPGATPPADPAQAAVAAKQAFVPPTPRFGAIPIPRAPLNANGAAAPLRAPAPPVPNKASNIMAPVPPPPAPIPPPAPEAPASTGQTIFLAKNAPLLPSVTNMSGPLQGAPDTAFVPVTPEVAAMHEEFVKIFFEGAPETMSGIRKSLRAYSKEPATPTGLAQLNGFYRKVHSLTGAAGMASLESIGNFASCLEAFLREISLNPVAFQPSTLRTLASAVDLLGIMFDKGAECKCPIPTSPVVLIVDDDVLSRRAVSFGLEKAKLKAVGTADPLHALEEMKKNQFELIFLDVDMPDMDGFELCTRIRQMPNYMKTPVVFITGMTDFQTRAKSITSGGNDFISKPLCFIELAVKALTFILKGRLAGTGSTPAPAPSTPSL